jgi:pheromone shutdown protein TraB
MSPGPRSEAVITLIGTGHVFDLRHRLQREVLARSPDVVGIELDPGRLQALLARQRGDPKAGNAPLAYRLLAEFQDRMAEDEGVLPGDELLAAYEAAVMAQVPVALIDQDAQQAFARLWKEMGLLEKARFLGSAAMGVVLPKSVLAKDVSQLKGDYSAMLEQLGKDYPTVKRVLLDERNVHMAQRILALRAQGKERVVAVVGDGHVDGIAALLRGAHGQELEVLRLRELQAEPDQGTASYSFTATVDLRPPGPAGQAGQAGQGGQGPRGAGPKP